MFKIQKTIILDKKGFIIEQILNLIEGNISHKISIENYLNKKDITFLKAYLSHLKPKSNPFNKCYLPKQKVLSNKDIIYNSLVKPIENSARKTISKSRLRKILRYDKPFFRKEKEQIAISLRNLQSKTQKRVKDIRVRNGLKYKTLINNELRTIIVNNSNLGILLNGVENKADMRFIDRIITKEIKRTQKDKRINVTT